MWDCDNVPRPILQSRNSWIYEGIEWWGCGLGVGRLISHRVHTCSHTSAIVARALKHVVLHLADQVCKKWKMYWKLHDLLIKDGNARISMQGYMRKNSGAKLLCWNIQMCLKFHIYGNTSSCKHICAHQILYYIRRRANGEWFKTTQAHLKDGNTFNGLQ